MLEAILLLEQNLGSALTRIAAARRCLDLNLVRWDPGLGQPVGNRLGAIEGGLIAVQLLGGVAGDPGIADDPDETRLCAIPGEDFVEGLAVGFVEGCRSAGESDIRDLGKGCGGRGDLLVLPDPAAVAVRTGSGGGKFGGGGAGWNLAEPIAAGIGGTGGGPGRCAPGAVAAGLAAAGADNSRGGGGAGWPACGCGNDAICGDCRVDSIGSGSGGCPGFRAPLPEVPRSAVAAEPAAAGLAPG